MGGRAALVASSASLPDHMFERTTRWRLQAEKLARLEHNGGWHSFRGLWATSRKHLPLKDVAQAGGWDDEGTLRCCQVADSKTMPHVVVGVEHWPRWIRTTIRKDTRSVGRGLSQCSTGS